MTHPSHTPPIRPLLGMFMGILAVSTAAIFIRYAQAYAPSLVIAAYRLTLASLVLAPFALSRHGVEVRSLRGRDLKLALLSGVFLALHFATWISSLEFTTVTSSVVLVSTSPLWVALMAPLTIKEPITRPVLAGMVMALLGSMIVGVSDSCAWEAGRLACPSISEFLQGGAFWGNILALAGAVMAAAYLLIGRRLRATTSLVTYIFVVYGAAAVVMILLALAGGYPLFGYPSQAYMWLVLLALVPQLLGHSTFNWALRYLSAAYVSITLLGEPVGSTILAYFLLNETPASVKVIGAILILSGIWVATQSEVRPAEPVDVPES